MRLQIIVNGTPADRKDVRGLEHTHFTYEYCLKGNHTFYGWMENDAGYVNSSRTKLTKDTMIKLVDIAVANRMEIRIF